MAPKTHNPGSDSVDEERFERLENQVITQAESSNSRGWKMFNSTVAFIVTALCAYAVAFGVWSVNSIHAIELVDKELLNKDQLTQQWIDQGPRFLIKDAENLKLQILSETNDRIDKKFAAIMEATVKINDALIANRLEMVQTKADINEVKNILKYLENQGKTSEAKNQVGVK